MYEDVSMMNKLAALRSQSLGYFTSHEADLIVETRWHYYTIKKKWHMQKQKQQQQANKQTKQKNNNEKTTTKN